MVTCMSQSVYRVGGCGQVRIVRIMFSYQLKEVDLGILHGFPVNKVETESMSKIARALGLRANSEAR